VTQEESIKRPEVGLEIATTADGRDITRPYTGPLLLPTDRVLRARGGGNLEIYEQVKSDWQVKTCFEQRRNAVISAEWQVDAASDRLVDQLAAEWLRIQLNRIAWDGLTDKMLWAVFYGFSVAELVWEIQDGKLGWKAIKVRNRRRFRFAPDGALRLLTPSQMLKGEPAPAPYFWHIATGADHDDEPYGIGLAHWLYWPTLFKRNDIAFWLTFVEKFASPTGIGKYPTGAKPEEKAALLAAIRAIRTDSGVIVPEGMVIELLEAKRSGASDYQALHDTMDEAIAKVVLGQTMTTENGSSKSQAEVHMEVRQDIVKADADLICESFNLGPVTWLTMFNFPNAQPPRVYRVLDEPEDLTASVERDGKIQKMGFKPGLEYVRERYGAHWEEAPSFPSSPLPERDTTAAADFAEPIALERQREEAQDRIDQLIAAAKSNGLEWRTFVEPRVQELLQLLDESDDLEQFRERVIELAEGPPNSDLTQALARCGFAARLLGRTPKE